MIVFDLQCGNAHIFEAWFGSSSDYESQRARGLIACPLCDDAGIAKAVMALAIAAKGNRRADGAMPAPPIPAEAPLAGAGSDNDRVTALLKAQRAMEAQSDYVGRRFAAEARAIHDSGEARAVHGEATVSEARALIEEGIGVLPLPFRPLARSDA